MTLLAVEAAGLAHLYPEVGEPCETPALYAATHPYAGVGDLAPLLTGVGKTVLCVPDDYVTTTVDVTPWVDQKWRAIMAHRGEVARELPLPGILARLPGDSRRRILSTEYFTRLASGPVPGNPLHLAS